MNNQYCSAHKTTPYNLVFGQLPHNDRNTAEILQNNNDDHNEEQDLEINNNNHNEEQDREINNDDHNEVPFSEDNDNSRNLEDHALIILLVIRIGIVLV